ncbi:MAG TPA: helicase-related protein [Candidatus Saccharimonadales bacterium]|nr:helicase-related protein [Candidatus Saccharimonadales bacterium]
MNPGSIVQCRNREWVLLPSDQENLLFLRPLTGATDEIVAVHKGLTDLVGYSFPEERVSSAKFPPPNSGDLSNVAGAHLLWQAARLTLREGATPLRSLGRVSIRPRTYQFVPLLMALRLDTVRMLIADDVGVGKTVEGLLIVREMLDRGEIKSLCVICPPYLCEQWQKELSEKFSLDAVIIRSGTVNQLERRIPHGGGSVYSHYPFQVVSIDFVKGDRKRDNFIQHCPDFVIVDEAHGAASASGANANQQQRHALLKDLAASPTRHLVLLTATPHSGVPEAFRSLLALLRPEFAGYEITALTEPQRIELARHFVQRTRKDIEKDWEAEHCFPKRVPSDEHYRLSDNYGKLFQDTYEFCTELVRTGQSLDKRQQRVRYWAALALLRCVMSSPAAAIAALDRRDSALAQTEDEVDFSQNIFESSNEQTDDSQPTPPVESAEQTLPESERRKLRELSRLAASIALTPDDTKLAGCAKLVAGLLREGFYPIVWCRYIATADYVADGLQRALSREFADVRVASITGMLSDDERRAKVAELTQEKRRVLVATDCLSEGINLQNAFNAALHYDLPWNPNRLEQREGRVDRYGQTLSKTVKTIRFFSPDNPVDGVVIRVLLNKAREIHQALGTHVPVPEESETVTQAVLKALFFRGRTVEEAMPQMELGLEIPEVAALHRSWDLDAAREKENRTRFAQRALKPDEVRQELEATDAVLGDPDAVRLFVLNAAQRLGLQIAPDRRQNVFRIIVSPEARASLPTAIAAALPIIKTGYWFVSFVSPTPEGAEYLGRNHRFVATLAQFLMEEALTKGAAARASRCGAMRTRAVSRLTNLYLLRLRFLIEQPDHTPMLAEEVLVIGHSGTSDKPVWLAGDEVLTLLEKAHADANIGDVEKRELVSVALGGWEKLDSTIKQNITGRADTLAEAHRRIRQAVSMRVRGLTVKPQMPPDLLGLLVLQPLVEEGRRENGEGR